MQDGICVTNAMPFRCKIGLTFQTIFNEFSPIKYNTLKNVKSKALKNITKVLIGSRSG